MPLALGSPYSLLFRMHGWPVPQAMQIWRRDLGLLTEQTPGNCVSAGAWLALLSVASLQVECNRAGVWGFPPSITSSLLLPPDCAHSTVNPDGMS